VHMPVIEFHQDEVCELPPKAEVLARSDKTGVEMFRLGDQVLGVQGHPEYSKDILMNIADRLLQRNLILVRSKLKSFTFWLGLVTVCSR
jgi:glucosinolate gamma-glutamyl hydrolase